MTRASQDEPPPATPEPRWLFPSLVLALLIPTVFTHRRGQHEVPVVLEQKTTILWKYLYLLASLKDSPAWVRHRRQTAEVGKQTLFAQFLAVCSASILAETLGYAGSFSSP
jgi:hypothetical protein